MIIVKEQNKIIPKHPKKSEKQVGKTDFFSGLRPAIGFWSKKVDKFNKREFNGLKKIQ